MYAHVHIPYESRQNWTLRDVTAEGETEQQTLYTSQLKLSMPGVTSTGTVSTRTGRRGGQTLDNQKTLRWAVFVHLGRTHTEPIPDPVLNEHCGLEWKMRRSSC